MKTSEYIAEQRKIHNRDRRNIKRHVRNHPMSEAFTDEVRERLYVVPANNLRAFYGMKHLLNIDDVRKFWQANLLYLYRMFLTVPERNVVDGLCSWQDYDPMGEPDREPRCKTIACIGGWAALMPRFREMGLRPDINGGPAFQLDAELAGRDWRRYTTRVRYGSEGSHVATALFGVPFLFAYASGAGEQAVSDHSAKHVALMRIQEAIIANSVRFRVLPEVKASSRLYVPYTSE